MNEQLRTGALQKDLLNESTLADGVEFEPSYGTIQEEEAFLKGLKGSQGSERLSEVSKTDLFPKTGLFLTTANIVKAFVGLGILAAPYGFREVGFFLATGMILTNGVLNCYTLHIQALAKEHYGRRVKTYTDLGEACYGEFGRVMIAAVIIIGQFFCCSGYVMFFIQQMDQVIQHTSGDFINDSKFFLFVLSFSILAPLSVIEGMKNVSYISMTAMVSIIIALSYIIYSSVEEVSHPAFERELSLVRVKGIPYFFGISMFMFEGNAVTLEIYHQMEDASKNFVRSLGYALFITVAFILSIGSLAYSAYG